MQHFKRTSSINQRRSTLLLLNFFFLILMHVISLHLPYSLINLKMENETMKAIYIKIKFYWNLMLYIYIFSHVSVAMQLLPLLNNKERRLWHPFTNKLTREGCVLGYIRLRGKSGGKFFIDELYITFTSEPNTPLELELSFRLRVIAIGHVSCWLVFIDSREKVWPSCLTNRPAEF